jgi:hypothetical protein
MEPEQPKPPPATFVRVRPEDVQTSCERTMWTQSVQEPRPELEDERDLCDDAAVKDDLE